MFICFTVKKLFSLMVILFTSVFASLATESRPQRYHWRQFHAWSAMLKFSFIKFMFSGQIFKSSPFSIDFYIWQIVCFQSSVRAIVNILEIIKPQGFLGNYLMCSSHRNYIKILFINTFYTYFYTCIKYVFWFSRSEVDDPKVWRSLKKWENILKKKFRMFIKAAL